MILVEKSQGSYHKQYKLLPGSRYLANLCDQKGLCQPESISPRHLRLCSFANKADATNPDTTSFVFLMLSTIKCLRSTRSCLQRLCSSKMYKGFNQIILVNGTVEEGLGERYFKHASDYAKASLSQYGVARYDVLRDAKNPDGFCFVEIYQYNDVFTNQIESSHFEKLVEHTDDMLNKELDMCEYKSLYPRQVHLLIKTFRL
jgi:quinol monooxygenase YgiN